MANFGEIRISDEEIEVHIVVPRTIWGKRLSKEQLMELLRGTIEDSLKKLEEKLNDECAH